MRKAEASWSGMRKYLEKEMLSDELKGRVRYNCSTAAGMDGCRFFEIYVDNKCFKRFSLETVNSYFIESGIIEKKQRLNTAEYWDGFWETLDRYPLNTRTEYTDGEFCDALEKYRNSDIKDSINSENPVRLMFALLDRRTGKRTLQKFKEGIEKYPDWIKQLVFLRV